MTDEPPDPRTLVERLTMEIEAQRVRHADLRDPNRAAPPADGAAGPQAPKRLAVQLPLRLLWHRREITTIRPGQYRLTVPLAGGPPPPHASRELNRILHQMWVSYPSSERSAATAVAAVVTPRENGSVGVAQQLIVLLTVTVSEPDRQVGTVEMARQLRAALDQLATRLP